MIKFTLRIRTLKHNNRKYILCTILDFPAEVMGETSVGDTSSLLWNFTSLYIIKLTYKRHFQRFSSISCSGLSNMLADANLDHQA